MAKQSLGEKFISSAVRQVGRDLGKTVSNQLFGDAHSTPIRRVQEGNLTPLQKKMAEKEEKEKRGFLIACIIGGGIGVVLAALFGL